MGTTKSKIGERRTYYLEQVRIIPGIFPKVESPQTATLGKFKQKGICIFMKEAGQRKI